MPVLVAYGSSDEEDEIPATKTNAKSVPVNGTTSLHTPASNVVNPQPEPETSKPVLGPSIPTGSEQAELSYGEDSNTFLPDLPEQDLLRYLTQPSHSVAQIPPEPSGTADPAVTAKFKRFLELKSKGIHFNEDLASKSSFRNPSLFANLLERSGLPAESQYTSTLPKNIFDPSSIPSWAYKEELLKSQQSYAAELNAAKKAQSSTGKRIIDFAPSSRDSIPNAQQKRRRPDE